jgi:uncharacterized damage-inducible protein DinB
MSGLPEPWLRGPIPGVSPLVAPILYTFQQAQEDLAEWTEGLTNEQLWARPHGFGSAGFHVQHITRSTDRLMTYLQGRGLSVGQMAFLEREHNGEGTSREDLLLALKNVFQKAEAVVRALDPAALAEPRFVGRLKLPTTVAGLLTHIAEHTQRHIGQAISAAKLARLQ